MKNVARFQGASRPGRKHGASFSLKTVGLFECAITVVLLYGKHNCSCASGVLEAAGLSSRAAYYPREQA